jgi:hypothetical protein
MGIVLTVYFLPLNGDQLTAGIIWCSDNLARLAIFDISYDLTLEGPDWDLAHQYLETPRASHTVVWDTKKFCISLPLVRKSVFQWRYVACQWILWHAVMALNSTAKEVLACTRTTIGRRRCGTTVYPRSRRLVWDHGIYSLIWHQCLCVSCSLYPRHHFIAAYDSPSISSHVVCILFFIDSLLPICSSFKAFETR